MSEPAAAEAAPRAGRWLDAVVVLVFAALMLQGFTSHVDVHVDDEVYYQQLGRSLLDGEPSASVLGYAPVYAAAYALLQLLPWRGLEVQDAMAVVVVLGAAVSMWYALGAFVPRTAAVLGAMWWAASPLLLAFPLRVYAFTACCYLLALGLIGRGRAAAGVLLLALAALNRLEHVPWLLGAGAGLAWLGRRRAPRLRTAGWLGLSLAAALVLLAACAGGAKKHSWLAFQDHYAGNLIAGPGEEPRIGLPLDEQARIAERDFPGARTIPAALLANPSAFAAHVGRNVAAVPRSVLANVAQPFAHWPSLHTALLSAVAILAAVGLLAGRRAGCPAPGAAGYTALWTSWLVVPSLLAIFPRSGFVLAASLSLLIAVAVLAQRGARALAAPLPSAWRRHELVLAATLAAATWAGGPFVQTAAERGGIAGQGREIVRLLRRHELPPTARVAVTHPRGVLALAAVDAAPVDLDTAFANAPDDGASVADYAVFSSWDYLGPRRDQLLGRLLGPSWELLDAGWSTLLFRRRGHR